MKNSNQVMTKMSVILIELWLKGKIELVKPVNQYMTPPNPNSKVVSVDDQYRCHD
jgi:hypothetical protein